MSSYKSAMKEVQAQGDEKASKRAKLILQWSKIEVLVLTCLVASWMWFNQDYSRLIGQGLCNGTGTVSINLMQ